VPFHTELVEQNLLIATVLGNGVIYTLFNHSENCNIFTGICSVWFCSKKW